MTDSYDMCCFQTSNLSLFWGRLTDKTSGFRALSFSMRSDNFEHGNPKVNVWCGLMHDRVIGTATIKSNNYLDMLENFVLMQLIDLHPEVIYQQDVAPLLVGQITAIFERNRANDVTSIKFGTFVLQGILIKSARLAIWKSKMAAIFQDGHQVSLPKLTFCLEVFVVVQFAWSRCGFVCFQACWSGFSCF